MKKGHLSEYFFGVAAKTLSAVEADPGASHQHEFNGVSRLKGILGTEKRTMPARFVYLDDSEEAPASADGFLTWYDAREAHPTRSEHRLYFPTTAVSDRFAAGDLFIMGLRPDGSALCVVAEGGSTSANQALWLFGIGRDGLDGFAVADEAATDAVRLEYASRLILDEIGVEPEPELESLLDRVLAKFGPSFPTTRAFSAFAREMSGLDARDGADDVLAAWMDVEEAAFRALERHTIAERLKTGFGGAGGDVDVDGFISFSLGVQNRRKSRAGYALENHLEAVFAAHGIRHDRTAVTENKNKPDFLFPGVAEYRDLAFPAARLTMLAAKTSAKDRWRQILGEADRIPAKHLITLEPSISENQTDEMKARQVSLVLPRSIHSSYSAAQRPWLLDVESFIGLVSGRE
jgi:ADP-ribose pyrophosphatase YjhB (NUDIX family)